MTTDGHSWSPSVSANSWPYVVRRTHQEARRLLVPVLMFMLAFACLAMLVRTVMPQSYRASAEIFIDPRGLQVFDNELVTGQYDANAGVNYVESQMHVLLSGQVLGRAMQILEGRGATLPEADAPPVGPSALSARQIEDLRRNVSVARAERSYIISVSARAAAPEDAAQLANAVVQAYLDEDASSQSTVAGRLTDNLGSRLEQLRQRLAASEDRVEEHRRRYNLVSTDEQLIVDQQLTAAVRAQGVAEERLAAARVRRDQLVNAEPNTIMTLADVNDQGRLSALLDRLSAAREEYARLATRLGSMHPDLRSAQGQVGEVEQLLRAEIARMRDASAILLRQAEEEFASTSRTVETLTTQSTEARQSSIALRTLEEQVRSDRELLAAFETRSREMSEFARIDSTNIRVLSWAYEPDGGMSLRGLIVWGVAGAFVAALAGAGLVILRVMRDIARPYLAPPLSETPPPAPVRTVHPPRRAISPARAEASL